VTRRTWNDLPVSVRTAIEGETGTVLGADIPDAGRNSDFSATLRMSDGVQFCKGIRDVDGKRGAMHRHERYINPYLPSTVAPRLRWSTEVDEWLLLGFDRMPGHHADLAPGSPDLALVAAAVTTLTREMTDCPADAPRLAQQWARLAAWRRLAVEVPADLDEWTRDRLDLLVDWERRAIELVNGDSLVHTDLHSLNILVGDGRARVVDWAWSRLGASAVDVAFLIDRLIAAGHTPPAAEQWAKTIPAWQETSAETRTAFAVAIWGIWEYVQRRNGMPSGIDLVSAARRWTQHRLGQAPS
jgi:hypothetical protein